MVKLLPAVTGVAIAIGVFTATPPQADAMARYKWKNRPLLVFAPAAKSPKLARQLVILRNNRAGFRSRDMVVLVVSGDRLSMAMGAAPRIGGSALRRRYSVARGRFRVILVGKDGGTKL